MKAGFLDRTVQIDGQFHRYQVFVPDDYVPARRWPVILFLHGSGERGADGRAPTAVGLGSALRRHAERYPAIVVFPQAPSDALWTGSAAKIALQALEQTEQEFNTDPQRVYLTGLSMGGSGAWHLAFRDPGRYAALLVICGRIEPSYTALARRLTSLPIWVFHGDAGDVIPVEQSRRIHAALETVGAPVRYTELPGSPTMPGMPPTVRQRSPSGCCRNGGEPATEVRLLHRAASTLATLPYTRLLLGATSITGEPIG